MLCDGPFAFGRDYLLPLFDPTMQHPLPRMAEYEDASALCRAVLELVRVPVPLVRGKAVKWVLGPGRLLDPSLVAAFRQHSERKTLVSVGSPLPGVARSKLDEPGRWARDRSRGYDHSVGALISGLQVCK